MSIPHLVLVRHGQTDFNAQRRFQGQSQNRLNANGRDQARRSGEVLANYLRPILKEGGGIVEARASDLPRAWETSEIVAERLLAASAIAEINFVREPLLRELNVGALQDRTVEEFEADHPGVLANFYRNYEVDPHHARYPGEASESRAMVGARIAPLIQALNAKVSGEESVRKEVYLWVTHGALIDILLEMVEPGGGMGKRAIGNGDILCLEPQVRYQKDRANIASGLPKSLLKDPPSKLARSLGCNVSWSVLRHYQIGDAIAARVVPAEDKSTLVDDK